VSQSQSEDLAGSKYVTVIARLVVDKQGALRRGDLADTEGAGLVRFVGLEGLEEAMRVLLAQRAKRCGYADA
jgi:hypothetical protein